MCIYWSAGLGWVVVFWPLRPSGGNNNNSNTNDSNHNNNHDNNSINNNINIDLLAPQAPQALSTPARLPGSDPS